MSAIVAAVERRSIVLVAIVAALCAAPTVGDVGSCGQKAAPLGAPEFFGARLQLECDRCRRCGYSSRACVRACDALARHAIPPSFPEGCSPVVHDGEVCLRALDALSCSAFGDVVSDAPIVPTECDFCPADGGP